MLSHTPVFLLKNLSSIRVLDLNESKGDHLGFIQPELLQDADGQSSHPHENSNKEAILLATAAVSYSVEPIVCKSDSQMARFFKKIHGTENSECRNLIIRWIDWNSVQQ